MADDSNKARSATQLVRAQQAEDGRRAMAEYEAKAAATRANTERLRALRLARDAAAPAKPAAKPKAAARGGAKAKKPARVAAKLADWLDDQQKSGRNT